MKRRLVVWVLVLVCLGAVRARADAPAPRDIWPQATAAIDAGDIDGAMAAYRRAYRTRASSFGMIAMALTSAPCGRLWLSEAELRRSLSG